MAGDFQKNVREVIEAKDTVREKQPKTQLSALGIDCDSLTPEEIVVQVGILQKFKLLRHSISQRGKSKPSPCHKRAKNADKQKTRWTG